MRTYAGTRAVTLLVSALLAAGAESTAHAQYFGRNKVQYKNFQFDTLTTDHFRVYFYPEERQAAGDLARMAERWYARLSKFFGHELSTLQPLVAYASSPDFRQTNVIAGQIGEGTGGVTEGFKRRIVMPFAGSLAETDHVLGHELVHAFQYDIARRDPNDSAGSSIERLSLWFIEGMAEYVSVGHVDPHTAMWIRDAAREPAKLPSIAQLDDPRYFPYRWGQALWAYIAGRWGDDAVVRVFEEALRSGSSAALERVTGLTINELSQEWHDAIRAQYAPILEANTRASAQGRSITADQKRRGALAVSPSLSPDGRRVVYLSERDMLSVDLYVADADTGQMIRKLVNTAIDPHFSSLQFIASAGSWDPHGRQFVFGAIREGRPELAIIDVDRGQRVRDIPLAELGEILNPSWSPDGGSIAFSAITGGHSDLFIYDLRQNVLRRLTNDAFADLQPSWSPDGSRLAFVTDRFSTDLTSLQAGRLGLALLDPASGRIEALATVQHGKSINPQWAPDGRRIYFLADPSGLTNVYVVDVATGRVNRLTNLDAGASGITALSPALSAPLDANRLAFSAYEEGRIGIYILDGRNEVTGVPVDVSAASDTAAVLPPARRASDELQALLNDPITGLPPHIGTEAPYRPRLSLDYVGRPYVAVGATRFGGMYGGGLSFSMSDMLGNHTLFTAVDVNNYGGGFTDVFKNTGALVAYQNMARRWNWGVAGGQTPYVAGGFASGITTSGGQTALVEQQIIQRQTYRGLNSGVAYPLNQSRRLEFGGGYQQVTFDQQVRTVVTSFVSGRQLSDTTENTALADGLNLGMATAATVFDTAVFGPTSPVAGQRSRFEVSPTFGTIAFTGALADYRRYFMPARFYTVAGRVMHYGRYGPGSEDPRLLPMFIGYPDLIRGYTIGSFRSSECGAGPAGSCEAFDRLLGSRMLIGNLELRFPLLRPFGVHDRMYGPIPIEVAFFADAGVAWQKSDRPTFLGGDRHPVSSAGVTLRANLFGFAVGQIDLAYPFQRPGRGWVLGFSIAPGF
ncbi:MAG TPA: hypothetical protein VGQ10_03510 [Vicinamibacterales bacterium]|nr:hypothetical protein [Vicinamibacterales bacterium]